MSINIFPRRHYTYLAASITVVYGINPDICTILYRYGLLLFINDVITHPFIDTYEIYLRSIKRLILSTDVQEVNVVVVVVVKLVVAGREGGEVLVVAQ